MNEAVKVWHTKGNCCMVTLGMQNLSSSVQESTMPGTGLAYVTGFEKRDLIMQIMIFLYRRFSATTSKNNSQGQNFCVCLRGISHSLPTLTLSLRG